MTCGPRNLFNGVNPFGNRDANAFLYRADDPSNPWKTTVSLYMPFRIACTSSLT